jgi:hypothetical protein
VGYRHIDCASVYGNEKVVGEGLKDFIAQVRGQCMLSLHMLLMPPASHSCLTFAVLSSENVLIYMPALPFSGLQGKRSELFIVSKVWNDAHRPEAVRWG